MWNWPNHPKFVTLVSKYDLDVLVVANASITCINMCGKSSQYTDADIYVE